MLLLHVFFKQKEDRHSELDLKSNRSEADEQGWVVLLAEKFLFPGPD